MKLKLLSVFLLVVMYLNIMGYYWVLVGLHYNSTVALEKKLNAENYSVHETVTFRFYLTLPYSPGEKGFERAEGQFEYNGEYYHLIKQQYANDTLQLICIKNQEAKRINQTLNDYVETFADQPTTNHPFKAGQAMKALSSLAKDYLPQEFSLSHSSIGWAISFPYPNSKQLPLISFRTPVNQPPEVV